jgi:hypothetical protein
VKGSFFLQKLTRSSVKVTTDELEQALALTKEDSDSEEDHKILEGIVRFGKTEACQIMTPRIEVEAIDAEADEAKKAKLATGLTKIEAELTAAKTALAELEKYKINPQKPKYIEYPDLRTITITN